MVTPYVRWRFVHDTASLAVSSKAGSIRSLLLGNCMMSGFPVRGDWDAREIELNEGYNYHINSNQRKSVSGIGKDVRLRAVYLS